jgi:hypothetical protein
MAMPQARDRRFDLPAADVNRGSGSPEAPLRLRSILVDLALLLLGLTLVVLFALQFLVFLLSWTPQVETFRDVLVERVSAEAPMVLVGLVFNLI